MLHTSSHISQNTDADHLSSFYTTFEQIRNRKFDGMIITGAPVENLDFTDVDYWDELCEIMDWSRTHVHSTLHICWGAQAGLFYHYGIRNTLCPKSCPEFSAIPLLKAVSAVPWLNDEFYIPHSRYTANRMEDILAQPELELLAISRRQGSLLSKARITAAFHYRAPGYDPDTLSNEYFRDSNRGAHRCPRPLFPQR